LADVAVVWTLATFCAPAQNPVCAPVANEHATLRRHARRLRRHHAVEMGLRVRGMACKGGPQATGDRKTGGGVCGVGVVALALV
jgi:hypothetical protein